MRRHEGEPMSIGHETPERASGGEWPVGLGLPRQEKMRRHQEPDEHSGGHACGERRG